MVNLVSVNSIKIKIIAKCAKTKKTHFNYYLLTYFKNSPSTTSLDTHMLFQSISKTPSGCICFATQQTQTLRCTYDSQLMSYVLVSF